MRVAEWLARWLGRLLRAALLLGLALGVGVALAGLALAWRLSQGPLDMDWAARRIEAAANADPAAEAFQVRLSIGHAALRWNGFAGGAGQEVQTLLQDVRLSGPGGDAVVRLDALDVALSVWPLLVGRVVPRAVALTGLDAHLLRGRAGDVALDLGGVAGDAPGTGGAQDDGTPGPSVAETLAELARPARREGGRFVRPELRSVEALRSVVLKDTVLRLRATGMRGVLWLGVSTLDLQRQQGGGVRGSAGASLALGAARATVALQADLTPEGGTTIRMELAPVNARTAQDAAPELASEDTLDAAVGGMATLGLDPALHPTGATLRLEAGAGHLRLAGSFIGFDSVSLEGQATWDRPAWSWPQSMDLTQSRVVLRALAAAGPPPRPPPPTW